MNNKSVSCEEIRAIIENLTPQTLSKTEHKQFKEHLAECSPCRQLYEKNLALNRILNHWETPKPGKNLQAQIMAKIAQIERERARLAQPVDFWGQLKSLLGYRFRVPAFATLLLLAFLLGSIAINVALISKAPEPVRITQPVEKPGTQVMPVVKGVQPFVAPSPQQQMVTQESFMYPTGYYQAAMGAGTFQPALIVILGVPPVPSGQMGSYPQKVYTIQNLPEKEELL